jgi:SET domain-containing protein
VTRSQEDGTCAIALWHGSLYNHSSLPNAMVVKNSDTNTLIIRSLCEIKKDEEICVDYLSHSNVEELRFKEI